MSSKKLLPANFNFSENSDLIVKKCITDSSIIAESFYKKPVKHSKHSHKKAYFTLVNESVYKEKIGRKTFFHNPGTIVWRPARISHEDEMKRIGGTSFSVYINTDFLDKLSQYSKIPEAFSEKNTTLIWLAFRLRQEFRNWQNCSPLITEGIVLEMLGYATKKKTIIDKKQPKWMNQILEKLNEEFKENLTNTELARLANIHPVYLAKSFRKFHNQTIGEYVKNLRVRRAAEMLMNRETPLSEIALLTGFSDQSHFTKVFKKITGTTPGAFRKNLV